VVNNNFEKKKNFFAIFYLAAKLRLSIVTTASAAVIYHKCSCYLEKSDFDQYVSLERFDKIDSKCFVS
jgi:hypothetical protein